MGHIGRWASFWVVVLACFGFVAYVGLTGTRTMMSADSTTYTEPAAPASPTTTPAPKQVALFVGDSYVAGSSTVAQRATFAARTCARLALTCRYDAAQATGYLSGSGENGAYPDRLAAAARWKPDVVVIEGGRADLGSGSVRDVAEAYYTAVQEQFGSAAIVVLEPFWNNATPPANMVEMRSELKAAAAAAGVTYVPTTDWLNDNLMSADGVTPTSAGHRALANRTIPVVRDALAG